MFRTDLLSVIRSLNTAHTATGICHTEIYPCRKTCVRWHQKHGQQLRPHFRRKFNVGKHRERKTYISGCYRVRIVSSRGYKVVRARLPPPEPHTPKTCCGAHEGQWRRHKSQTRQHLIIQSADRVRKMTFSRKRLSLFWDYAELCKYNAGGTFSTLNS